MIRQQLGHVIIQHSHTVFSLCAQRSNIKKEKKKKKKAAARRRPRKRHSQVTKNIFLPSQYLLRRACSSCVSAEAWARLRCRSLGNDLLAAGFISGSSGAVGAADGRRWGAEGSGWRGRGGGGLPGPMLAGWWCSLMGGATSSGTVPGAGGRRMVPGCFSYLDWLFVVRLRFSPQTLQTFRRNSPPRFLSD